MNGYDVVCYVCGQALLKVADPIWGVEPRTMIWCAHCTSNRVLTQCLLRSDPFGAGCTNYVEVFKC